MKKYLTFAFGFSILAILFGLRSNFSASIYGGWIDAFKHFEGLLLTVAFLVAWLLYGIVIGYSKKRDFIKFISLYWGISGLIALFAYFMAPIGKLAIIAIPVFLLTLTPTYSLVNYLNLKPDFIPSIICLIVSWSSGAIGYLIGYLLEKSRIGMLRD